MLMAKISALQNTYVKIGQGVLHASALLGIIDDYVIDSGENGNGSWEKWFSGKLVQKKVVIVARTATSTFVDYTWTFPFPFNDDKKIIYSGVFECIHQGVDYRYGKLLTRFSGSVAQKIFRGKDEDSSLFNDYKFRLKAEGTWK